jgi:hypothetical protein
MTPLRGSKHVAWLKYTNINCTLILLCSADILHPIHFLLAQAQIHTYICTYIYTYIHMYIHAYYAYPKLSGLVPPPILWRQSGIFWIYLCMPSCTDAHTHTHTRTPQFIRTTEYYGQLQCEQNGNLMSSLFAHEFSPPNLSHRYFHDCGTLCFIVEKYNREILVAGGFGVVCGLNVQHCTLSLVRNLVSACWRLI